MPRLTLRLFGPFQVTLDGETRTEFYSDKVRALLCYLALEGRQPLRRQALATLLWDGYAPQSARASLRTALSQLRRSLSPLDWLAVTRRTVQFKGVPPDFWCDALAFAALLKACEEHPHPDRARCPPCREMLRQAAALHQGGFLDGLDAIDSLPFETWRQEQREKHQAQIGSIRAALQAAPPPRHNLPRQTTPLIGREAVVKQLQGRLLHPDYPFITLVGPGGIGKTRLALAAAERVKDSFADGVWFVPLTGVSTSDDETQGGVETTEAHNEISDALAAAIGGVLGCIFGGAQSLPSQLFKQLRAKHLLLVLDNFEHLLAGANFIPTLLQEAPHVSVLVTSHRRLNLQMEYVFQVEGLPVPAPEISIPEDDGFLDTYGSLRLFAERADRTTPGFALDASNQRHAMQICRLVAGVPLGIELAAALVERQTSAEIAVALQQSLDALASSMGDLPARHRSMRAVFDYSWRLLSVSEQTTLAGSSVFRGEFGREAALSVVSDQLSVISDRSVRDTDYWSLITDNCLSSLVERFLLRRTEAGRYEIHPLVRQFAAEKLSADPAHFQSASQLHSRYYLNFVAERESDLRQATSRNALAAIRRELANVRQAWRWAVDQCELALLERSLTGLASFYDRVGFFQEGEMAFGIAVQRLDGLLEVGADCHDPQDAKRVLGALLAEQADFLVKLSAYERSLAGARKAVQLAQTDKARARAHAIWAAALWRQGKYEAAQRRLGKARSLYHQIGDQWGEGGALNSLGAILGHQGAYAPAQKCFEHALVVRRAIGDHLGESTTLVNLAFLCLLRGDYSQAIVHYEAALRTQRAIGDRPGEGNTLINLGFACHSQGDHARARHYYELAQPIFGQIGDRHSESTLLASIGLLCHHMDDDESARAHSQQARAMAQEIGSRYAQALASTYLGHALAGLGNLGRAAAAYREALSIWRETGHDHESMDALAGLARVALKQRDREAACGHVETILGHLERNPTLEGTLEPARVFLTCFQTLQANEDPRAGTVLQSAQELLQARAAKIRDEETRQMFWENVEAHREILAARPA